MRMMTGISNFSERAKASFVKSLHSWESDGSIIMIETREAIASLDQLASVCDFFSIGSNDLTRAEEAAHPDLDAAAIREILLQDIEASVNAGHRHGIRVCICGEMGSDPYLTGTFVKMGIDMLSMSPAEILPIRKIIRGME